MVLSSNPQHFSIAMLSQRTSKPCWLLWPIKRPQKTTLQSHLASSPKSPKIPRPAIGRVATEIHFPFWSMRTNSDLGIRTSGLCRSCWKVMMNLCDVPPVPFLSPHLKIKMLESSNSKYNGENTCISVPLLLIHIEENIFSAVSCLFLSVFQFWICSYLPSLISIFWLATRLERGHPHVQVLVILGHIAYRPSTQTQSTRQPEFAGRF